MSRLLALSLAMLSLAAAPPEPLACVPAQADLLAVVEQPRQLVEAVVGLKPIQELAALDGAREFLDSTGPRRFQQFLSYYVKELGHPWPELLDQLAGGGVYLAAKQGTNPAMAVLIVRARDEALLKRFGELALQLVEQELARQDAKERPERATYEGVDTIRIGEQTHIALVGPTLILASRAEVLHATLDVMRGEKPSLADNKGPNRAKALVGPEALAWSWLDLTPAKSTPQGKEAFKLPRDNAAQTLFLGGWVDAVQRSPFLAAGMVKANKGLTTTFRLPAERVGLPEALALHVPPAGQPGSKPDLTPASVLFSSSFYLDLAKLWTERTKLLTERQVKDFERLDQQAGRFLQSLSVSKLLQQTGPYHRVVVTAPRPIDYDLGDRTVQFRIPAFAFVTTMSDPAFAKAVDPALRAAALAAGTQTKLIYGEENVDGVKLVGWRFAEDGQLRNDRGNNRFNFSPCFANVGDQFFVASNLALGRELIGLLKAEQSAPPASRPETVRMRFPAGGAADMIAAYPEQIITQTVLDRFVSWAEAKKQADEFLAWLRRSGGVTITADYGSKAFHFDITYSTNE